MAEIDPAAVRWTVGDEVVLWHPDTGRHVRLQASTLASLHQPRMEAVRRRLQREHLLGERPEVGDLIVARSRLALLLPDRPALWLPIPEVHTAGGHAWRALALTAEELALWCAANGARSMVAVAESAGVGLASAKRFFRQLTAPSVQAAQLRHTPPHPRDASLARVVGSPRQRNQRTQDQHDQQGATSLRHYHLHGITDGNTHFDDRETTVAHALAVPHPALAHEPYGRALRKRLEAHGAQTSRVVEVGCGDGELAEAWGSHANYIRVDLSPELLRTQATRNPSSPGVQGDATRLPLRDRSVQLLISNEVIADLAAGPSAAGFTVSPLPPGSVYNTGAMAFVTEIARVLAPGGMAFLSEFGDLDAIPTETEQLDHPEVSIRFSHLVEVAEQLGLQATCIPLASLLMADLTAPQMARHHWHGVRALARSQGIHLRARAWTPALWDQHRPLPEAVEGIEWVPLHHEGPGPLITRFQALILRRQRGGVAVGGDDPITA
jgi:SAM-dependent methyltransferase